MDPESYWLRQGSNVAECFASAAIDVPGMRYDDLFDYFARGDKLEGEILSCVDVLDGISFKDNNRYEGREIIVNNKPGRVNHEIGNIMMKVVAEEFKQEAMTAKGKAIPRLQKIIGNAYEDIEKRNKELMSIIDSTQQSMQGTQLQDWIHFCSVN